eukprot:625945-Rhodomonas_salina.1
MWSESRGALAHAPPPEKTQHAASPAWSSGGQLSQQESACPACDASSLPPLALVGITHSRRTDQDGSDFISILTISRRWPLLTRPAPP